MVDTRAATTSLDIAEHFGKRHDHVCRDIRRICAETPEKFHAPNFGEMSRTVKIGNGAEREETYFTVYFDGFILLVMGYTGKKALGMKLAYIEAFNAMREELEHRKEPVENPDKLPAPDSPLTPDQQCTLQAIVRAKIEALPPEQRGGLYPKTWSRFNNHFRLAKYAQLPQSSPGDTICARCSSSSAGLFPDSAISATSFPSSPKQAPLLLPSIFPLS
nr:Rha family transcriptional regulator [uncultured Desulfovibrio sp.]